jgi:hypothetical protein
MRCECPACHASLSRRQARRERELEEKRAERAVIDCVADLAGVNDRDNFYRGLHSLLEHTRLFQGTTKTSFSAKELAAFRTVATLLSKATKAIQKLPDNPYRMLACHILAARYPARLPSKRLPLFVPPPEHWLYTLEIIHNVFAELAGTVPSFFLLSTHGDARRRPMAEPQGGARDWPILYFAMTLWCCAHENGGNLRASHKDGRGYGTMFKALEILKPLLPVNFISSNKAQAMVKWTKDVERAVRSKEKN